MEKFSAYRDAGTGIQPFLYPVPPSMPNILARVMLPLGILLGIGRTLLIILISLLYFLSVEVFLSVFYIFNESLYNTLSWILTAFFSRLSLWILGFYWIHVSYVTKARGRRVVKLPWKPHGGDIIVSNWASWVEILWLAFRFNPIFLLPVPANSPEDETKNEPIITPSRRSALSPATSRSPSPRIPIKGYQRVSLLRILNLTGNSPPYKGVGSSVQTLEELQANATRPLVVFPECTTSNGRALLKFVPLNPSSVPIDRFKIFMMCARYGAPTIYTPSLTHPVPFRILNPIQHVFAVCSTISPLLYQSFSIRLLSPAESPNNGEIPSRFDNQNDLFEACANSISQLGKLRITGLAWEDKISFLDLYKSKYVDRLQ